MELESRPRKPSRKIYSITQAGRQKLQEWINRPAESNASLKAFLMRLILADNFSQVGLITQLSQRRAQITAHRADLEKKAELAVDRVNSGQRLALEYGLALATAELAWLDSALDRLSHQPKAMEVVKGEATDLLE
jgi:DNA-binding PadR family transcriptional regulator